MIITDNCKMPDIENHQNQVQNDQNNNVVAVQVANDPVHEIVDLPDGEADQNGNWRRRRLVRTPDGVWRRTGRLRRVNYHD